MRLYSFVNGLYMNSIQYGIQTAHVVSDMAQLGYTVYECWAKEHKTIVILDAINLAGLKYVYKTLSDFTEILSRHPESQEFFPVVKFHEDEDSLGGIMTCVGIVVPEEIYDYSGEYIDDLTFTTQGPRRVIQNFQKSVDNNESLEWTPERVKFWIYCLLKSYNLAPR